ncbi:hypothetical protein WISP_118413 [Willisornis vidua]|uniref:Uncharacterized protein n=1 Tax=Willisornis vidua TaxID=1566151 RepID=A0ABQ9CT77_9PASS|nr:hypothetical protein WISP_118413 [Willisornis vidua]
MPIGFRMDLLAKADTSNEGFLSSLAPVDLLATEDPNMSGDEGAGGRVRQAALHHFSTLQAHWEVPDDWKLANVTPKQTHEEPEGGSRKEQAGQPDHSAWQGYGADHLEYNHTAPTGQTGDQTQSAEI